ncbi:uncharacterized protein BDR25DRAFT_354349 [Lindgomyces ingoldianus]|uniref:Uncharacterized protein n=1 Tax=Lindgomyces ingoldianus TaxID=673940 RepID=A0ACB6QY46_9PLEO|nr:uncharacterized protein BDR25DRAFT_354349 [Lindgomyces ingoldianus]KAF2471841.1 hypothetical protein BDR25DRAFT_354349 [Lindgomyces ingoldianus]
MLHEIWCPDLTKLLHLCIRRRWEGGDGKSPNIHSLRRRKEYTARRREFPVSSSSHATPPSRFIERLLCVFSLNLNIRVTSRLFTKMSPVMHIRVPGRPGDGSAPSGAVADRKAAAVEYRALLKRMFPNLDSLALSEFFRSPTTHKCAGNNVDEDMTMPTKGTGFFDLGDKTRECVLRYVLVDSNPINVPATLYEPHEVPEVIHTDPRLTNMGMRIYFSENTFHFKYPEILEDFASKNKKATKVIRKLGLDLDSKFLIRVVSWLKPFENLNELTIGINERSLVEYMSNTSEGFQKCEMHPQDISFQLNLLVLRVPGMDALRAVRVPKVTFTPLIHGSKDDKVYALRTTGPIPVGVLDTIVAKEMMRPKDPKRSLKRTHTPVSNIAVAAIHPHAPAFRFLDLPAELRNQIYLPTAVPARTSPPTANTISQEATGIYYATNEFVFYYPAQLMAFIQVLGASRRAMIEKVTLWYKTQSQGGIETTDISLMMAKQLSGLKELEVAVSLDSRYYEKSRRLEFRWASGRCRWVSKNGRRRVEDVGEMGICGVGGVARYQMIYLINYAASKFLRAKKRVKQWEESVDVWVTSYYLCIFEVTPSQEPSSIQLPISLQSSSLMKKITKMSQESSRAQTPPFPAKIWLKIQRRELRELSMSIMYFGVNWKDLYLKAYLLFCTRINRWLIIRILIVEPRPYICRLHIASILSHTKQSIPQRSMSTKHLGRIEMYLGLIAWFRNKRNLDLETPFKSVIERFTTQGRRIIDHPAVTHSHKPSSLSLFQGPHQLLDRYNTLISNSLLLLISFQVICSRRDCSLVGGMSLVRSDVLWIEGLRVDRAVNHRALGFTRSYLDSSASKGTTSLWDSSKDGQISWRLFPQLFHTATHHSHTNVVLSFHVLDSIGVTTIFARLRNWITYNSSAWFVSVTDLGGSRSLNQFLEKTYPPFGARCLDLHSTKKNVLYRLLYASNSTMTIDISCLEARMFLLSPLISRTLSIDIIVDEFEM